MKYSRYFIRKVDNSKPGITNSSAQSSHSTITTCTGTSSTTITSSLPEPHTTSYRGREKAPRPPLEPAEDNHFRDFVHRCMPQTMYGQKIRDFVFITFFLTYGPGRVILMQVSSNQTNHGRPTFSVIFLASLCTK